MFRDNKHLHCKKLIGIARSIDFDRHWAYKIVKTILFNFIKETIERRRGNEHMACIENPLFTLNNGAQSSRKIYAVFLTHN